MAGLPVGSVQQLADVQFLALHPGSKARGGQQVVERHHQLEALLGRVEGLQVENTDLLHRRILHIPDDRLQVQIFTVVPCPAEDRGKQNVLPALDSLGFYANQVEQAHHGRADSILEKFAVLQNSRLRRSKRLQDGDRKSGAAARRVHNKLRGLSQALDALAGLPPLLQTLFPQVGLLLGELLDGKTLTACLFLTHPRSEVLRLQFREGKQQIG